MGHLPPYRPAAAPLDEEEFWRAWAGIRPQVGEPMALLARVSDEVVQGLDDTAVQAFQARFIERTGRLHTWRHRAATELLLGECDEHRFVQFAAYLVVYGRETFQRVVADADALADIEFAGPPTAEYDQWTFGTELAEYAPRVGEAVGGIVMHRRPGWEDENFDRSFPAWAALAAPPGAQYPDAAAARADLPRLAARALDPATPRLPGWSLVNLGPYVDTSEPELIVEIWIPMAGVDHDRMEEFFHTADRYLECQEHGLTAEWFDDGEQVGDDYVLSVWRAPEPELLKAARLLAALPVVPPGAYALVTTTHDQLSGRGRRVVLGPA